MAKRELPLLPCKHEIDPSLWRNLAPFTKLKECVVCYTLEDL